MKILEPAFSFVLKRPEIISVTADEGKVTVRWTAVEGADKYIIRRSLSSAEGYEKLGSVTSDNLEYCDINDGDGVYWYKVVALKNSEDGYIKKGSKPQSVVVCSLKAPVAEKCFLNKKGKITLRWSSEEKADYFEVFRRYSFMNTLSLAGVTEGEKLSFTDKSSVKGQLFYYCVRACVRNGEEVRYSAVSNELFNVCFDKVPVLEVIRKHRKRVVVKIRLTAGADGYILFKGREENGEFKEAFRNSDITQLELPHHAEKGEKSAYYKVACYKNTPDGEIIGPAGDAVFVKYRI